PIAVFVMAVETLIGVCLSGSGIVCRYHLQGTLAQIGNGIRETQVLVAGGWVVFNSNVRRRQSLKVRVMDRTWRSGKRNVHREFKTEYNGGNHEDCRPTHSSLRDRTNCSHALISHKSAPSVMPGSLST